MSRKLRDNLAYALFWVLVTVVNGWSIGRYMAQNDNVGAAFGAVFGGIGVIMATFKIHDTWVDWQDERYERAYLASVELPVVEEVDVDARTISIFNKEI